MIKKGFLIFCTLFAIVILFLKFGENDSSSERKITFMATTTLEDSGFLQYIIRKLEKDTGLSFKIITAGTGQVLRMAKDGNADILLVHDPRAEKNFITEGHAVKRIPVFYNDFILIGPKADPANINGLNNMAEVFTQLKSSKSRFISRGDDSGTHQAENNIWMSLALNPDDFLKIWYQKTGSGMGASLNIAIHNGGYIFSDRATWIAFNNKQNHEILFEDKAAKELKNIYSLLLLNPQKLSSINPKTMKIITSWFQSSKTNIYLKKFRKNDQRLYFLKQPSN
jgi:tungstate transport system substrate-binding protein